MTNLTQNERKALEIMQKDNFRGISKDNVMQLMSILDKVDPEVAKEIISQLPEVVRGMVETEKGYLDLLTKGIESSENSTNSCFSSEDALIDSLQKEVSREGTSFEEKKYYIEKIEAAAIRKEKKDSEHKNVVLTVLKFGGQAFVFGLCLTAGIFIGKADMRLPLNNSHNFQ